MHFTVEQCFLSAINSDGEFERIMARINRREQLDHEDISKLVILPLTKRGKPDKRQMIDQVIDAASKLKETYASDATVVLSLVTTVMRNYISKGQLEKVKEMIRMSPLGKMFYDEMEQKLEQKDIEMEQKLEQKDIEMEQKLEQKDKEYASFLVSAIDALVQCQIKLEDACAKFGKKTTDYTAAKAMLAGA